ncbi:chymotrypsin-2 [Drosophila grimshawi]|uniref:GH14063 n=1 Tax=Drosophila grimshawi TaxID=7222 RepID=B4JY88_DROGR|nr:chymotrypsin-2 [Drosophila grimshawi]EDV90650.1 GH14063 [Drosophila grimshawi]
MGSITKSMLISLSLSFCLLLLQSQSSHGMRLRGKQLPGELAKASRPSSRLIQGRIAGGQQAKEGAWPWIVSIQNQFEFPFCSGVIIGDVWILTAASCVAGLRARNLVIVAGTVSTWNITAPGYYTDRIHIHCNFDKPLYHNDIALLHLTEKIEYNSVVAKITLAEIDELQQNEALTFAGWGMESTEGSVSQYLQQSDGSYLNVDDCRKTLGDTEDVDLGHVCVQMKSGKGVCYGDAGGPLINDRQQLVGIGNWGIPCARGFPDVYSRVAFYNDWIRSTIEGCGIA